MDRKLIFLLIVAYQSAAFAPMPSFSSRYISQGNHQRQRHVAYLRLPQLPFLKRKQDEEFSTDSTSILENTSVVASSPAEVHVNSTTMASTGTDEKELTETEKLLKQVKDAGLAGVISYALWELGFWFVSVPVVLFGYYEVTGHLPDLSDKEDVAKLGAEAFAFVNFARFAVPLRIGLALSTTPWIQSNIVDRFLQKSTDDQNR